MIEELTIISADTVCKLKAAEQLLSRGTRDCRVMHESVARCPNGHPLYPFGYIPECKLEFQHLGCPHFLEKYFTEIREALTLVLDETLIQKFGELSKLQAELDTGIRIARTGVENLGKLGAVQRIPTIEEGEQNAKEYLKQFQKNSEEIQQLCDEALGRIRTMLLGTHVVASSS